MRFMLGLVIPLAEICLGWLWLARSVDAAARVLVFAWWADVAVLLGFSLLLAVAGLILDRKLPKPKPAKRLMRYWLRGVFFVRVVAQVAVGCTTLAVFSLVSWLFCRLTMLIVTDVMNAPNLTEGR